MKMKIIELIKLIKLIKTDIARNKRKLFFSFIDMNTRAVIAFRINHFIYMNCSKKISIILHNFHRRKYNVDIYPKVQIGSGFKIAHLGAIVIGDGVKIGRNVTIQSGVTVGQKDIKSGYPIIKDNVYIGTGAKVLGDVIIESNAVIGANAVVLHNVKQGEIAVGAPARCLKRNDKK
ncbi:hypothetical protein SK500_003155 [Providencia stuartii]|nr:hypothetical protein [Providencia stuartii]EMD5260123.1 hypothetical protein [Providencia stuartii]